MVKKTPIHSRRIELDSYLRDDDLWELQARLVDVKSYDFERKDGTIHESGRPVHDMTATLTTDSKGLIQAADIHYDAAPFGSACESIDSAYEALVGLHLLRNFKDDLKRLFSRTKGCTHMTELLGSLPSVFVQSLASQRNSQTVADGKRPFVIGGCHAYATSSPVVKMYYPQWYKPNKPSRM